MHTLRRAEDIRMRPTWSESTLLLSNIPAPCSMTVWNKQRENEDEENYTLLEAEGI